MGFTITNGILKKYVPDSNRSKVVIPDGVTAIKPRAFENCYHLESVVIPATVTSIGAGAFRNCARLQDVTIPETVKTIGHYAFFNCVSLYRIAIPTGSVKVESGAFEGCFRIWDVAVPNLNVFSTLGLPEVRTLILTDDLAEVKANALKGCHMLETIRFANGKSFTLDMADFKENLEMTVPEIWNALLLGDFMAIPSAVRFHVAVDFFAVSGSEASKAFIKKNFTKLVKSLIDEKDLERIQKIVANGKFFNKRNIDKLVEYASSAVEKGGSEEIQTYLATFKANAE